MNTKSLGLSREETLRLIEIRKKIEEGDDFTYEEAERQATEIFSRHSDHPSSLAFLAVHVCTSDDFGWYDEDDWMAAGVSVRQGDAEKEVGWMDTVSIRQEVVEKKVREMLGRISQEKGSIVPERKVRFLTGKWSWV